MSHFPDGFLWGAATAGHQVEGNNVLADIWAMEHVTNAPFAEPSGDACDSYHRYEEDIQLLADSGLNTYRFSIEWSRIQPEPTLFSRAELEHYRRMILACTTRGITPVVTLNHFTVPAWFARDGAWAQAEAATLFEQYVRYVVSGVGDLVDWWVTFNEPNAGALLLATGALPLGAAADDLAEAQRGLMTEFAARVGGTPGVATMAIPVLAPGAVENVFEAHRLARAAIKNITPDARVGWSIAVHDFQALPGGELQRDAILAQAIHPYWEVARDDDFIGVQTYTRETYGPDGRVPAEPCADTFLTGWEYYPAALGHTVAAAASYTGVPVLVTENGMATADDDARIRYTREALQGLVQAVNDGATVLGYIHWTLIDNWEWHSGYAMTFGLIGVDPATFARSPKPSLAWLGATAQTNGFSLSLPPSLISAER
ncbi:glycoside hydrolase family 1 protein [Leifsonia aquatica]|uniref:glycoside hydrolase family 1 protein n=1 Tax=Leifsonia aquatica TaxID=144185 RepID=UPI0028B1DABD|nr:family 1 glycosylhydrolase [Leifsonia aquatica]